MDSHSDPQKIQETFQRLGPWITKFTINGTPCGGNFDLVKDKRIEQFFQCFSSAATILELGSLEGGHTLALSKFPGVKRVVAVEGRQSNIEKAKYVQELFGMNNVEFVNGNLETMNLSTLGVFDAVFCVGILYHLKTPWRLIEQVSPLSRNLFIWTHYVDNGQASVTHAEYEGKMYKEYGAEDPLSGMSSVSFWPTLESLNLMLSKYGFSEIRILEQNRDHPNGMCITLAAVRQRPMVG